MGRETKSRSNETIPAGTGSPTTITLGAKESSEMSSWTMSAWSNRRNVDGTTTTRAAVHSRIYRTWRCRMIVVIGTTVAPIRTQARYRTVKCHQLGSCTATLSEG